MKITGKGAVVVYTGTRAELAGEAEALALGILRNACAWNWEQAERAAELAQYAATVRFFGASSATVARFRFEIED